jgi:hypothetical protein
MPSPDRENSYSYLMSGPSKLLFLPELLPRDSRRAKGFCLHDRHKRKNKQPVKSSVTPPGREKSPAQTYLGTVAKKVPGCIQIEYFL